VGDGGGSSVTPHPLWGRERNGRDDRRVECGKKGEEARKSADTSNLTPW